MKTLAHTILFVLGTLLCFWITISENERKSLKYDKECIKMDLNLKQDTLDYYKKIHLHAIDLNKIVDSNYQTRKQKEKLKFIDYGI